MFVCLVWWQGASAGQRTVYAALPDLSETLFLRSWFLSVFCMSAVVAESMMILFRLECKMYSLLLSVHSTS